MSIIHQRFMVEGMSCAACSRAIETELNKNQYVKKAVVNLLNNTLDLTFDSNLTTDEIIYIVARIGYQLSLFKDTNKQINEYGKMKKKLLYSCILCIPLMFIAMGNMFGISFLKQFANYGNGLYFGLIQLILVTGIIILNIHYFKKGFSALFKGYPNMDSLISIGASAAILYSLYIIIITVIRQTELHHLYFETAGMILTIVSLGKLLEAKAKYQTKSSLQNLLQLLPKQASVIENNNVVIKDIDEVRLHDKLLVKPGEKVPLDGIIIEGNSYFDESNITGESLPHYRTINDVVIGSTINHNSAIIMEVTKVKGQTFIDEMINLVEIASSSKAPVERLADQISRFFVPIIIILSLIVFFIWYLTTKSIETALLNAISILVIACPCSLGLATPTSMMVAMGKAAENGILFKSAESIEKLNKVTTVCFDKTNTLTEGKFKIVSNTLDNNDFQILMSLENLSNHPLAQPIIEMGQQLHLSLLEVHDYQNIPGLGIKGKINGEDYFVGNSEFMQKEKIDDFIKEEIDNNSIIYLGKKDKYLGFIKLSDTIKEDSYLAIDAINKLNIQTILLTGDNYQSAIYVKEQLGINKVIAEVIPQKKEEVIIDLQKNNEIVAMVGDGVNDAIALTRADVGLAIGTGTDIAIDVAEVIVVNSNPLDIYYAIMLCKKTYRNIKQNLFWALFYNIIAVIMASGIYYLIFKKPFNPMIASIAMSISSLFVVTNALRLRKITNRLKERKINQMEKVIEIKGMMCQHCANHVKTALEKIKGATCTVDLTKNQAVLSFNSKDDYLNVSNDEIITLVKEAGYEVTKFIN